tara:strand:- start:415 stop:597 length:183 start_codon:yes stop_codon:yes gene_type:complete
MNGDNVAIDVAVEQYQWWRGQRWTLREMVDATQQSWHVGMTGDDVVIELATAWDALPRHG